jgi:hypothetical protein
VSDLWKALGMVASAAVLGALLLVIAIMLGLI